MDSGLNINSSIVKAPVVTVTFDTNTLAAVVKPEAAQLENGENGRILRDAIRADLVQGFFSETIITVEGITNRERSRYLGQSRIVTDAVVTGTPSPGKPIGFQLSVGSEHVRPELDEQAAERIAGAFDLGMRVLRTAATFDRYPLDPAIYPYYEPDGGTDEWIRCMDRVNHISSEIGQKGLGRAKAVALGVEFTKRDAVATPELWLQGLGRARHDDRNRVSKATREWADGDSVAAHYGFGMKYFCTEDIAKNRVGTSILSPDSRVWLKKDFGILFVRLGELVQLLPSCS